MKTIDVINGLICLLAILQAWIIHRLQKELNKRKRFSASTIGELIKKVYVDVGGHYLIMERITTKRDLLLYHTEAEGVYAERALLRSVTATNGIVLEQDGLTDQDIITSVNIHELVTENRNTVNVTQSNIMDPSDIGMINQVLKGNKDADQWLKDKYHLNNIGLLQKPDLNTSLN